ncbi:hypothetical protein EMCRGX_G009977 [Ephydatia muelleri]
MMKRASTLSLDTRNDLYLTTAGVGYVTKTTSEFPSQNFKMTLTNPLPERLAPPPNGLVVEDIYQSTTSVAHDYKPQCTAVGQPTFRKAPANCRVQYTLDTLEKLAAKPWRRPLTMAYQLSEMKAKYKGQVDLTSNLTPHPKQLQTATLADHFANGPTKTLVPSTENPKGHGRSFIPQEQAVLFRNEPYMTSNNWYHRTFSKQELSGYPRRDAATYWQCEDYPKAWGHGTARNPLSKSMGDETMRDRRLFKTATAVFRQPRTMHPTHKGLQSLYAESYPRPTDAQLGEVFDCPVQPIGATNGSRYVSDASCSMYVLYYEHDLWK